MGTINRIKDVFVRLKLRRKSYFRRGSLVAIISMLLVSYQNCSQGKFEIDEGQMVSASKSSTDVNGSGSADNSGAGDGGSGGGGDIPTPPPTGTDPGPSQPTYTQAQVDAEKARRQRCAAAIKNPVFENANDFSNKIVNIKSGLGGNSGDMQNGNAYSVTVDSSLGIDSTKFQPLDACIFRTYMRVEAVSGDAARPAVFENGIGPSGQQLVVGGDNTALSLLGNTLQIRTNGNNDQEADFSSAARTLNAGFNLRAGQNGAERATRCVQGSLYYRVRIITRTNGLTDPKPPLPQNQITVQDVIRESSVQYVKVDIENTCWKEHNLARIMGAADPSAIPATNAHLGTAVAIDGEWAAAVSDTEYTGAGYKGYIYLFRKVSDNWTFFQKLEAPNGTGTALTGVALKGSLLAVSSSGDGLYRSFPYRQGYPGRIYLYNLSGSELTTPFQTIKNPANIGTKFGSGVAIAGNSIAIGDSHTNGKVHLYNYVNGMYGEGSTSDRTPSVTQNGVDIGTGILGFGANVVYQGNRLIVGAYKGNESYAGSVHLFDIGGGSFASRVSKDAPTGITARGNFGYAIAFDGTSLAVGAYENETNGLASGAIVYYEDYSLTTAPDVMQGSAAEERFGVSLAFAGDSLYVGSRGGTGSSGTINRYKKDRLDQDDAAPYNSRVFVHRSHDANNGEGFSYAMSVLGGVATPTLLVSSQTKDYIIGADNTRAKAGGLYLYEVK